MSGTGPGAAGDLRRIVAVAGQLSALTAAQRTLLLERGGSPARDVGATVRDIIEAVRTRGDVALRELAQQHDGVQLDALEIPRSVCHEALAAIEAHVRAALELAASNIAAFHSAQLPSVLEVEPLPGVRLGRRADPLRRVGVYAPGGRAAYPSSILMGVVPARVAGVDEVIVCSPPGPDGLPPRAVLAACALAGADRVFALGGAGAVAALAFGTQSVPRTDKIVGPGNVYVTEAKRQLNGVVAIDSPAGPSEVLIIGDGSADPALIAAEMLAQAEHDPDAAAVLLSTSAQECTAVAEALERLLATQPRAEIMRAALGARGALLHVADLAQASRFAESYAPEHLVVLTADPRALLPQLRAAGTILLGAPSSVAFGDYISGANHVLPTAGLARAWSGLSTLDFVRWTTYQELTSAAAARLAAPTACLAEAEGLPAHALAARMRALARPEQAEPEQAGREQPGSAHAALAQPGSAHAASTQPAPVQAASAQNAGARVGTEAAAAAPPAVRLRDAYRELTPYDPGRAPCATDLSDNTNLFGAPPSVLPLLAALQDSTITRYPSVYAPELKRALASLLGVEPENVTTGCGSDDLIDSAVRAFCETGDTVAYPEPTFGMVPVFARMNATVPVPVPLDGDFELDAAALLATRAPLTYLCRPNNPTGTLFERAATERVCRGAAGVVLIDEAYADFAGDDCVAMAVRSDRTIVLRTLSKAFGLAGLRVGFAVGPAALIREVEKSRGPYKLNGVAETAALRVLSSDVAWVHETVREVRHSRERLSSELATRGVRHWPSAANFVLVQVPGSALEWNGRLRAHGVAVRPFPQLPHAGECVRVSVGPWAMLQRFLTAFDHVLETMRQA